MLKVRGTWAADEFVEGIVDDQARNYTKRVLGTFFTYSWLYDGVVPDLHESFYAISVQRHFSPPLLKALLKRSEAEVLGATPA